MVHTVHICKQPMNNCENAANRAILIQLDIGRKIPNERSLRELEIDRFFEQKWPDEDV